MSTLEEATYAYLTPEGVLKQVEGNPGTVFLTNGVKLSGTIHGVYPRSDTGEFVIYRDGVYQVVFKHAVATIMPMNATKAEPDDNIGNTVGPANSKKYVSLMGEIEEIKDMSTRFRPSYYEKLSETIIYIPLSVIRNAATLTVGQGFVEVEQWFVDKHRPHKPTKEHYEKKDKLFR